MRGYKSTVSNLIGLIRHSFAFIGVASGPFIVAMVTIPERTLFLEKSHPLKTYTKKNIAKVEIFKYQPGFVKEWLKKLNQKT